jgi:hypothetical protein
LYSYEANGNMYEANGKINETNGKINEANGKINAAYLASKKITFTWENINVYLPDKKKNCCNKLPCFRKEVERTHIIQNGSL